ncbi:MAG: DUF4190 domain-containing protein [Solirubrobacteraceae bacterium]
MSGDPESSWAPFGPGPDKDDDEPRAGDPPPQAQPEPEAPRAGFAPPAPAPLPPLPPRPPAAEASPLAWPDPALHASEPPASPPPERQAPWPPQGFQTRKPVPSDATAALVVGIASVAFCGFIGPFAIHYGLKARRQIDADPALGGRGLATWGYALGIVSTSVLIVLLGLVAAGIIVLT